MTPRGLPGPLPAGERVLWQGAPDRHILARRALHVRKLLLYFAVVVAAVGANEAATGGTIVLSMARAAGFAAIPVVLALLYAWGTARWTVYTITDQRLVLRIGLALPLTINLPFTRVEAADAVVFGDGSGDVSVSLIGRDKLGYVILWPHARPWRFGKPQPTLRGLRDAAAVAQLLARSLAASADMAAPVLQNGAKAATHAPHATAAA